MTAFSVTHQRPPKGDIVLPCCGLTLMSPQIGAFDRVSDDPELVTCGKGFAPDRKGAQQ